jgi:hypothetical protein
LIGAHVKTSVAAHLQVAGRDDGCCPRQGT